MVGEEDAQPSEKKRSSKQAKSAAGRDLRSRRAGRNPSDESVVAKSSAAPAGFVVRRAPDWPAARELDAQRRAIAAKAAAVVELAGSKAEVARMLGVARTQPGQWIRGEETPSAETWELIVDLEYVMSRAAFVWNPELVMPWLHSPNSFLDGARPIDVLRLHGPEELIGALNAEYAGSYA